MATYMCHDSVHQSAGCYRGLTFNSSAARQEDWATDCGLWSGLSVGGGWFSVGAAAAKDVC